MKDNQEESRGHGHGRGGGCGCGGGGGGCGCGQGRANKGADDTQSIKTLEERQRNLEQELADVAAQLKGLGVTTH